MTIDWSKAPDWAQFVAQDADGSWHWYQDAPGNAVFENQWAVDTGRHQRLGAEPVATWKVTLQRRPDPELIEETRAALAATPAAAPVVLPEPVMFAIDRFDAYFRSANAVPPNARISAPTSEWQALRALLATATGLPAQAAEQAPVLYVSKEQLDNHRDHADSEAGRHLPCRITPAGKFTAPLFAAPQAQAVERGEVLVTVSGFTGSGKSAIAGEIEIMCRALGLQVEWPDSDSEKHMTHADWIAALEQYKPRVRIVECNVPHSVVKGQDK